MLACQLKEGHATDDTADPFGSDEDDEEELDNELFIEDGEGESGGEIESESENESSAESEDECGN